MANPEHLKILKQGVEVWNEWRNENPDVEPDLSRADLGEANLRKADLAGADLCEANLRRVDLRRADLVGADLRRADLSGADLRRADLSEANLSEADISGANLSRANLSCTEFIKANLSDANLIRVMFDDGLGSSADLSGAILEGTVFTEEHVSKPDASFLDLASTYGLETATFDDPQFLPRYIERAFEYAHREELAERKKYPFFVESTLKRIKALRSLYKSVEPPRQLILAIKDITAELIKYLKAHPKALYEIKPRQFEELVAEILAGFGWKVSLTHATRDGGYDIFAINRDVSGLKDAWIVECKKYSAENKVGVGIARSLYGLISDLKVNSALLATTSCFSEDAEKYAASRYGLELRDYNGILEWINEYKPNPDGRLYIKDNRLRIGDNDE